MSRNPCSATRWEVGLVAGLIEKQGGRTYVEFGSHTGGSLWSFGSAMPRGSTLIGIEPRPNDELNDVVAALGRTNRPTTIIEGKSTDPVVIAHLSEVVTSIDVLLIDGDHRAETARRDLDNYLPMMADGGMVIMHDCGWAKGARPITNRNAHILAPLHALWKEYSAGRRRLMLQEWPGYGVFWK